MGREPLGFLSPVAALVTIYRKGDVTHHSMLSKNEVPNIKQMYSNIYEMYSSKYAIIMKFANQNVSR